MNMSYCRFENTVRDLKDCQENMDSKDLSKSEKLARIELIRVAYDILESLGATIEQDVDELLPVDDDLDQDDFN